VNVGAKAAMNKAEAILAWVLIGLGVMQCTAAPVFFKTAEEPAFWFFGGGITLAVVGAMNLLRLRYGAVARGLVLVSVGSNVVLALFWVAMACVLTYKFNRYKAPYVALGLIVATGVLSIIAARRSASHRGTD
jgi:hypothetical protein